MNARRAMVLVLDIALLAGIAGYILWHSPGSDSGPAATTATAEAKAQGATKAGKKAQAHAVRSALMKLASDPDALVAKASRATVGDRARQAVPRGSKVTPVQRTWRPDGAGGGTMSVRIAPPGKRAVSYAAVMVREADGWKVLATIPLAKR